MFRYTPTRPPVALTFCSRVNIITEGTSHVFTYVSNANLTSVVICIG